MALTTCKDCGQQVSTSAKTCPHCGTPAPSKKKAKGKFWTWFLGFVVLGLIGAVMPKNDTMSPAAVTSPAMPGKVEAKKSLPPECSIAKKDGTMAERECDLEELCKDWVFFRKRAIESSADGEDAKAKEYQVGFNKTNTWLSAYREEDVQACLTRNGG